MKPRYLGDGVYASYDGYHICLHVGDHASLSVIKLDKEVFQQLVDYAGDVQTHEQESRAQAAQEEDDKR